MDYRQLLIKYIRHVGNIEGVTYIGPDNRSPDITDLEWVELLKLDQEADFPPNVPNLA